MNDLSKEHKPVSDFFTPPVSKDEWELYKLSDDQIEFYHEHGYVGGIRILDDTQINTLREETLELMDPQHPSNGLFYEYNSNESVDPNKTLFHALGAWRIASGLHDILWHPAYVVPASQLLGGAVRFWHDQLFCKPAMHGGVVAWHQDYSYWTRTKPIAHLTCWIGLDDSTVDNGCVQYIPGSHNWELLPITGLAGDMDAIQTVLSDEQKEQFKPVPVELKQGEAVFHHPLTVHGSYENRIDRPRRAVVINSFKDGVISDKDEPMLVGTDTVPKGQPMQGQFYPLLFDPESIN